MQLEHNEKKATFEEKWLKGIVLKPKLQTDIQMKHTYGTES